MLPLGALLFLLACQTPSKPVPLLAEVSLQSLVRDSSIVLIGKVAEVRTLGRVVFDSRPFESLKILIVVESVLKGQMPGQRVEVETYDIGGAASLSSRNRLVTGERYVFLLRSSSTGLRSVRDINQWSWRIKGGAPTMEEKPVRVGDAIANVLLQSNGDFATDFLSEGDVRTALRFAGPSVVVPLVRRLRKLANPVLSARSCAALLEEYPFDTRCMEHEVSDESSAIDKIRLKSAKAANHAFGLRIASEITSEDPAVIRPSFPVLSEHDLAFLKREYQLWSRNRFSEEF